MFLTSCIAGNSSEREIQVILINFSGVWNENVFSTFEVKTFLGLQRLHSTPATQTPFSPICLIVESSQITRNFLSVQVLLPSALHISYCFLYLESFLFSQLVLQNSVHILPFFKKSPLIISYFNCNFRLGAFSLYYPNTCTYHRFCLSIYLFS